MLICDKELIKRSQQGDIEAFEQLISKYQQKVYNIAYRLIGNTHDACDLAQEALIKVFKSIKSFRGDASFSTWLYHIITNVCRDELRKRSRCQTSFLDEPLVIGEEGEITKQIADVSNLPENALEKKELEAYLQELINSLNPEYRMVILLREVLGYSYEEIALNLNISLGTVKSRLNRARGYLKEKLMEDSDYNQKILGFSQQKKKA
ncbi:MAG: RNA polymerase sigma factor [Bacillota bacterium]|jgi:RNA polymerase sigma-70 factor (ECF subfamily)